MFLFASKKKRKKFVLLTLSSACQLEHFSGAFISISVPAFTTPSWIMFPVAVTHSFSIVVGMYCATSIEMDVPRGQLNVMGSCSQPFRVEVRKVCDNNAGRRKREKKMINLMFLLFF
jgi:hypothetical protein